MNGHPSWNRENHSEAGRSCLRRSEGATMDPSLVGTSKFLSLVLRHNPGAIGLTLDPRGWADVDDLINRAGRSGRPLTRDLIARIVATNDKQRFALSPDGAKIRANQGHSVAIDPGLTPVAPPDLLFHGTATRFLDSIRGGIDPRLTPPRPPLGRRGDGRQGRPAARQARRPDRPRRGDARGGDDLLPIRKWRLADGSRARRIPRFPSPVGSAVPTLRGDVHRLQPSRPDDLPGNDREQPERQEHVPPDAPQQGRGRPDE